MNNRTNHLKLLLLLSLWFISTTGHAADRSSAIKISPNGQQLAVVNNDSRSVSLLSLPGLEKVGEIFVGRDPRTLAFDTSGQSIYVTNRLDGTVSVIDVETRLVVATIPVPREPIGVVVSPCGKIFVSCTGANAIAIIDAGTLLVEGTIETETDPWGLALSQFR